MISRIQPTTGKANAPVYQLKVLLIGPKPDIWRWLRVPGNANLGWIHAVLQVTMGWTNTLIRGIFFKDSSSLRQKAPPY